MDMRKSETHERSLRAGGPGLDGHHRANRAWPSGTRRRPGFRSQIGILVLATSLVAPQASGADTAPPSGRTEAAEPDLSDADPADTTLESRAVSYANGDHYEGEWQDNAPHGRGSYTWANGDRYQGDWRKGRMHGHGTYVWTDGTLYEGGWREGLRHGTGTFSWTDGDRMRGEWLDGRRQVARAECLAVEKTSTGTTLWINRCDAGVDVLWRDEGACGSPETERWPCSWYVRPHELVQASIEGQVWWRECRSPGGLGDVVAAEKEDGAVFCIDDAGFETLVRTRVKRQHAERSLAATEAKEESGLRDAASRHPP